MIGKQIQLYKNCAGTITFSTGMSETDDSTSFGFTLTAVDAFNLGKALTLMACGLQSQTVNLLDQNSKAFMDCGHPPTKSNEDGWLNDNCNGWQNDLTNQ